MFYLKNKRKWLFFSQTGLKESGKNQKSGLEVHLEDMF
jgi:hypothetical protein